VPAVQRCKECTALVKDSGKAVPVYADVLEAVRMATTRNGKLERALELAREWNARAMARDLPADVMATLQ
jgi:hypothetical protein